jgi:hypothetical protein
MVSRFAKKFGVQASWTYFEAGHGKGPCDGVGGGIKKLADNRVKVGEVITDATEFCKVLATKVKQMNILRVTAQDVEESG